MPEHAATQPESFRLGAVRVDTRRNTIERDGRSWSLEPKIMDLLALLAARPGEVLSREDLIEQVWKVEFGADESLTRAISLLRKTFRDAGEPAELIETIPKRGYRLAQTPEFGPAGRPGAMALTDQPAHVSSLAPPSAPGQALNATKTEAPPAQLATASARRPDRWPLLAIGGGVAALIVAAGAWAFTAFTGPPPAAPVQSLTLAVLPFDSLSASDEDDLIALAMSREIRNTLSRVRGMRVVADASSFALAAEPLGAVAIGERLGADLLIDGSFAKTGDRVRMTAELVDARSGTNLWTGSREGPASDLDSVRQMISAAVFEQLVTRLGADRVEMSAPAQPTDPRIYRLMLEARETLFEAQDKRMIGDLEGSLEAGERLAALVKKALDIEPNSAAALAMQARIEVLSATRELWNSPLSQAERQGRAADTLRRALALDPDHVPALELLAEHYRRNEWRWADARALMERALALDPNHAPGHVNYSYLLTTVGRCVEAVEHARQAVQIAPGFWSSLARALKCAGRLDDSLELYMTSFAAERDNLFMFSKIYLGLLQRGDPALLRTFVEDVRDMWDVPPPTEMQEAFDRVGLAMDALEDRPDAFIARLELDVIELDARTALNRPSDRGRRTGDMYWTYAIEFAAAGQTQRVIDMLEKAIAAGSLYIPETMPYGVFEFTPEVRADPRYRSIWRTDARLAELVELRLEALKQKQMLGRLPDGSIVKPAP